MTLLSNIILPRIRIGKPVGRESTFRIGEGRKTQMPYTVIASDVFMPSRISRKWARRKLEFMFLVQKIVRGAYSLYHLGRYYVLHRQHLVLRRTCRGSEVRPPLQ